MTVYVYHVYVHINAEEEGSRGMNRSFTPEQQQVLKGD